MIVPAYVGSQYTKFHTARWTCWSFMSFYLESCIWPDDISRMDPTVCLCIKFCANFGKSGTETLAIIRHAFGEERISLWQSKPVTILCGHLVYRGRTEKHLLPFFYIQFEWLEGTGVTMGGKVARFWRRKCVLFPFYKCDCQKWSSEGCRRTLDKTASACESPSSSLVTTLFSGVAV
jgi:hypothetical protein